MDNTSTHWQEPLAGPSRPVNMEQRPREALLALGVTEANTLDSTPHQPEADVEILDIDCVTKEPDSRDSRDKILPPTIEELMEKLKDDRSRLYTKEKKDEAWTSTAKIIDDYSDELVKHWKEEIDTLLTFAGLFSAILTSFNVQSYQLLQPAPTDQTAAILTQISAQLSSFSVNSQSINSTQSAFGSMPPTPPFRPQLYAVWLNCLWFASLVFSIASATIGIMVKQWIREYSVGLYGTSREIARRRQYRLNYLIKWRVGLIVGLIPLLLQIAVVLFLAGIVVLVHNIHATVASVVTSLVAVLLAFQLVTTILPAMSARCCYRSPQAYCAMVIIRPLRYIISLAAVWLIAASSRFVTKLLYPRDRRWWVSAYRSIFAFADRWGEVYDTFHWTPIVWGGEEQAAATERPLALDADMVLMAYSVSRDAKCFDTASVCLTDFYDPQYTSQYIETLHARIVGGWGDVNFGVGGHPRPHESY